MGFSIGGLFKKDKSSSTTTENQKTSSTTDSESTGSSSGLGLSQLLNLNLAEGVATKGNEFSRNMLRNVIFTALEGAGRFSKDAAIADSEGAVTARLSSVVDSGLGGILGLKTSAGVMKSSGANLNTEKLLSRAIAESQGLQNQQIQAYADIQTNVLQQVSNLLGLVQSEDATTQEQQINEQLALEIQKMLEEMFAKEQVDATSSGTSSTKGKASSAGLSLGI